MIEFTDGCAVASYPVPMGLDDTHTDLEFKKRIADANGGWMKQFAKSEPDLAVEAFTGSLFARLLRLFSAEKP